MNVTKSEIIISAVSEAQYPQDALPEIVLLGRSNVGKSSFINTLINRKGLARTSSQPGKTQTMNFYQINDTFRFVDMPGYGYARVSKTEREKWGRMIEDYLQNRENMALIIQLVDSRHEPTEDDKLMYDWLVYYGLDPIVIATKADKISKTRQKKALDNIAKTLGLRQRSDVFLFSAAERRGKEEAWAVIEARIASAENGQSDA
ncbi:MAG: ribosome biogenesis GTP-binding protein YihA/YsxC [Eubacterium aggregans]|uniref:Probable GTP-binding protein EngB n=1 Tax=Eubacterium aggregans TaxID=81409 RepID=A0A1H4A533_9FIRM|nr:ribosome biogenesis GTP-binding protein YihA/YsxC [Eubacterium aggregans]MDD4690941.1 ribosome biogenesis GTP-binding protein YihA/YsxC [Eubacterium aggregans]MEA5074296.1 ribosome biogenesis GTP-binding protein YihA/YsxC [Eubacterium aggregans]SEA31010.1 GTP-binding protein [Eubacterium aggregans]